MLNLLKPICLLLLAAAASTPSLSAPQAAQTSGSSLSDAPPAPKPSPAPAKTSKPDTGYHVFRVESLSLSQAGLDADTTSPSAPDESSAVSSDFGKLPPSIDLSGDSVSEVADTDTSVASPSASSTDSSATMLPISATQAPAPRRAPAVLQVISKVVLVDVVVTEKGNPVHDLDRSRFHIIEDGYEQRITYFDEAKPAASASPAASAICITQTTAGIVSNVPCAASLGPVNVLLLDALNTPMANQADIQHQVLKYLAHMPPGTSLAVFLLGGHGELQMLSGFTMDIAQLEKAVRSDKAKPSLSVAMDTGMAQGLRTQADRQASTAPGQITTLSATNLRQAASDVDAQYSGLQTQLSLAALQQLARYLEAIPGRKNLIWFSGSFPIALIPDPLAADPALGQHQSKDVQEHGEDLRDTIHLLSVARIAVYPVYALGPMSTPSLDATYSIPGKQGLHSTEINLDDERALNQSHANEDSMRQIAEQTGGHYVNTNGLTGAMSNAIKNGASYYTLGYVPASKDHNGRYRDLKVDVDGANYGLAYRRGYFPDPAGIASDHSRNRTMQAATLPGAPPATQIQFQARVLPSTDPTFQSAKLSLGNGGMMTASLKGAVDHSIVDLAIDPRGLNFEVSPQGTYRQQLEFALIAYTADGRRVNYVDQGIQLNLKPDQYVRMLEEGTRIPHRMEIDLPSGEYTLRVVIMDPSTARTGSVDVPFALKARQSASLP
jgi:VWFA-related protein